MAVKAQPLVVKRTSTRQQERQQEHKTWVSLLLHKTVPGDASQKTWPARGNKNNDGKHAKGNPSGSPRSAEAGEAMQVAVTDKKKAKIVGPKPQEEKPSKPTDMKGKNINSIQQLTSHALHRSKRPAELRSKPDESAVAQPKAKGESRVAGSVVESKQPKKDVVKRELKPSPSAEGTLPESHGRSGVAARAKSAGKNGIVTGSKSREKAKAAPKTATASKMAEGAPPRSSLKKRCLSLTDSLSPTCPSSPDSSMPNLRHSRSMGERSITTPSPPLVRFGPATVQLVEVGPGGRLNPLGRKNRSRSGLPFLAPRDPMSLLLLPLLRPSSPKKLKRHLQNQAAMERYYLRTEEEEARWRAEEKKAARGVPEQYRSEPVAIRPLPGNGVADAGHGKGNEAENSSEKVTSVVEHSTDPVACVHQTTKASNNTDEDYDRKREDNSLVENNSNDASASRARQEKHASDDKFALNKEKRSSKMG